MCMTYYTVDDLRPGRPGWDVRQFSALAEAIDHYRALPMDGVRVLGMADDAHAYELIRCVRLFPGDTQGEDVLSADYRRSGLTKKNADLKSALDICLRRWTKGYTIKQPNMDCQPTEITALMRHRAVFS